MIILKQCGSYISNNRLKIFLSILSGFFMFMAFPDKNIHYFSWFCFVPLLFAIRNTSYKEAYCLSLITGMISVCGGYFWLTYLSENFIGIPFPLNYIFWLCAAFFTAQLFGLIFTGFKLLQEKTACNDFLLFPGILVTIWSVFPNIFFVNLANGMTFFPEVLQASEFTGAYGVDFIIALANITLFKMLDKDSFKKHIKGIIMAATIIILWLSYGFYAINLWDNKISTWDKKNIGLVQSNRVSSKDSLPIEPGEDHVSPFEMSLSKELVKKGAEVVIWPEGHFRGFLNRETINEAYKKFAAELGVSVLFHDLPAYRVENRIVYRNASIWLNEKGEYAGVYYKRRLVPFGEYIPILNHFETLENLLQLHSLTPGEDAKVFNISGMKIQPLICYEIQFGNFVAKSIGFMPAGKVILTQSNDGWYGKGAQSEQHRTSNTLRAIETRLPVVHLINNGKSAVVLPNGRTMYLSNSWKREAVNVMMPYNPVEGGSFYTKYPNLIFNLFRFFFVLLIARLYWKNKKSLKDL